MPFPERTQTVVIGAGTAGLSAAKALRQAGIDTIVLEATGHAGGRCITDASLFSTPFDLGGSWLHSAPINPLARLAEKAGLALHKRPW
ncbi:MAG: FAD-dependent oxidoreductase, partial [Paracoccaceae bacterium]|nr:FAD-dependent oxidoreductase [Paracoccaceae bacterium]